MIIAIPTNDREKIEKRSGPANEFSFFNINDIENPIFVENPHSSHDHETDGHKHSHSSMIEMLKANNTSTIIVDVIGKNFIKDLKNENFTIYKTELKNLKEIALKFKEDKGAFDEL